MNHKLKPTHSALSDVEKVGLKPIYFLTSLECHWNADSSWVNAEDENEEVKKALKVIKKENKKEKYKRNCNMM